VQLPVTLRLKPSPTLAIALVLAHGLAAVGLVPASLPPVLKISCWLVLACSLAFALWRHVFRLPAHALTLKPDGHMEIERHGNEAAEARINPRTTVFPWLVVLLLQIGKERVALTLPRDAVDAVGHRQLRLWLRWKATSD